MESKKITLIQPRHIYAPDFSFEKIGHIYMPTSLLAAATKFLNSGISVKFYDENIYECDTFDTTIGINLLGAPYIPTIYNYIKKLKSLYFSNYKLIIGGQIANGITAFQLSTMFNKNIVNGNNFNNLKNIFCFDHLHPIEELSLIPAYKLIPEDYMKIYLSHEFGFYLSQGCKYTCDFCAAKHNAINPDTGKINGTGEVYRNIEIAIKDLRYLITKAIQFDINKLVIYLSNLDLFQTPSMLNQFALKVIRIRKEYGNYDLKLRGLSTVRSFMQTHKKHPEIIKNIIQAGLYRIGFGIDGATPKVWKKIRKPQTESECINAISISNIHYGIIPETLMVFGHNNVEDEESLKLAYEFSAEMLDKYSALPRPHIAKDIVPGNDGWYNSANKNIVNLYINNPMLFQNLDFTAIPSPVTHPNNEFRDLVTKYYLKVCELPNCLTQYVLPELPSMDTIELSKVRAFNLKRYDI